MFFHNCTNKAQSILNVLFQIQFKRIQCQLHAFHGDRSVKANKSSQFWQDNEQVPLDLWR